MFKKLFIVIFLSVQLLQANAQTKPQRVVSIARETHPIEWYKEQAELWKAELKKNPQNEEAWINYYTAMRGIKNMSGGTKQTVKSLDSVADVVKKTIPNTFAGNFIMGYHLGLASPESFDYNKKAYSMQPENALVYSGLVNHYEMEMNLAERKNINQKWYKSNDLSAGLLNFNYNMLASLEPNAIIFTSGDNDTYPALMLQDALNYRTDVTVINLFLAQMKPYREKLLQKLNIQLPKKVIDSLDKAAEDESIFRDKFPDVVIRYAKNQPVYISLTADPSSFKIDQSKLYLVGLATKYSSQKIDNMALLKRNYEKNFMLDYLKLSFVNDPSVSILKYCNQNYLAPFLSLYNHYKLSEENAKADEIKTLILQIAKNGEVENEVLPLLK